MPKRDTNICLLRVVGAMEKQHPLIQFAMEGFTTLPFISMTFIKWATDTTYIYGVKIKKKNDYQIGLGALV